MQISNREEFIQKFASAKYFWDFLKDRSSENRSEICIVEGPCNYVQNLK